MSTLFKSITALMSSANSSSLDNMLSAQEETVKGPVDNDRNMKQKMTKEFLIKNFNERYTKRPDTGYDQYHEMASLQMFY